MKNLRSFSIVLSSLTIALLSLHAAAFKVSVTDKINDKRCTFVSEESCTTQSSKALEKCTEEHKEKAEKKDANTIVITGSETSKHRKPSLTGGIKSITSTKISADYYACSNTSTDEPVSVKSKSIEERLKTLNSLKEKQLISIEEYSKKREEILNDL